jgi:ERCC4-related helicase
VEFFEEHYRQPSQSQGGTRRRETRVMVFANLRDTTAQIVELLAQNQPTVRAVEFVGQQGGTYSPDVP